MTSKVMNIGCTGQIKNSFGIDLLISITEKSLNHMIYRERYDKLKMMLSVAYDQDQRSNISQSSNWPLFFE